MSVRRAITEYDWIYFVGRGETVTKKKVVYDKTGAHSFDAEHPETISKRKVRKLNAIE